MVYAMGVWAILSYEYRLPDIIQEAWGTAAVVWPWFLQLELKEHF